MEPRVRNRKLSSPGLTLVEFNVDRIVILEKIKKDEKKIMSWHSFCAWFEV